MKGLHLSAYYVKIIVEEKHHAVNGCEGYALSGFGPTLKKVHFFFNLKNQTDVRLEDLAKINLG